MTDPAPDQDEDAENAIREAMAGLVGTGKRAYSLSVPMEATRVLVAMGQGAITHQEASERIKKAIAALRSNGDLEAPAEGRFDWKIKQSSLAQK
jgi:hypothetical protein